MDKKGKWENRQYMHMLAKLPALQNNFTKDQTTLNPSIQQDIRMLMKVNQNAGQTVEQLQATILQKDTLLAQEVSALVKPIEHNITIEVIPNH